MKIDILRTVIVFIGLVVLSLGLGLGSRFMETAKSAELPPAIQELQDEGKDFVYKHRTGQMYLLDSVPAPTTRSYGWISPNSNGAGFVIMDNKLIVVGEAVHSISWYCFEGIDYVLVSKTEEFYECGI